MPYSCYICLWQTDGSPWYQKMGLARTTHHLIPQSLRKRIVKSGLYSQQDCLSCTVDLCRTCHDAAHAYFTHIEMARFLTTPDRLKSAMTAVGWMAVRGIIGTDPTKFNEFSFSDVSVSLYKIKNFTTRFGQSEGADACGSSTAAASGTAQPGIVALMQEKVDEAVNAALWANEEELSTTQATAMSLAKEEMEKEMQAKFASQAAVYEDRCASLELYIQRLDELFTAQQTKLKKVEDKAEAAASAGMQGLARGNIRLKVVQVSSRPIAALPKRLASPRTATTRHAPRNLVQSTLSVFPPPTAPEEEAVSDAEPASSSKASVNKFRRTSSKRHPVEEDLTSAVSCKHQNLSSKASGPPSGSSVLDEDSNEECHDIEEHEEASTSKGVSTPSGSSVLDEDSDEECNDIEEHAEASTSDGASTTSLATEFRVQPSSVTAGSAITKQGAKFNRTRARMQRDASASCADSRADLESGGQAQVSHRRLVVSKNAVGDSESQEAEKKGTEMDGGEMQDSEMNNGETVAEPDDYSSDEKEEHPGDTMDRDDGGSPKARIELQEQHLASQEVIDVDAIYCSTDTSEEEEGAEHTQIQMRGKAETGNACRSPTVMRDQLPRRRESSASSGSSEEETSLQKSMPAAPPVVKASTSKAKVLEKKIAMQAVLPVKFQTNAWEGTESDSDGESDSSENN